MDQDGGRAGSEERKGDDMTTTCSVSVNEPGTWGAFHPHPCGRRAKVERDGRFYCTVHDPEYRAAKERAKCHYRPLGLPLCGKPAVEVEGSGYGRCAQHTLAVLVAKERLAAAAPDLLAAAEALWQQRIGGLALPYEQAKAWLALGAAIAKAKGTPHDP